MEQPDYIERTILKLKRKYSKDELVAALLKKISEKDVEIGQLTSEVQHLQSELEKTISEKENNKEVNKVAKAIARKDELYIIQKNENTRLREEIKKVRQNNSELINKICLLKNK